MKNSLRISGLLAATLSVPAAIAEPWLEPGDIRLRHDIQLLSDAGLLPAPVTSWPIYAPDLIQALPQPREYNELPPWLAAAMQRVQRRLRKEIRLGTSEPKTSLSVASDPLLLRDFANEAKYQVEAGVEAGFMTSTWAVKLDASVVDETTRPGDDQWRLDGSYVTASWGNWLATVGAQPHWWGPGWDGSLIWSNTARPVPGIAIDRKYSKPFETKWLSWLGPWKFHAFMGQLEAERFVPNAKFIGLRLDFRPTDNIEIGLSRSGHWGGEGRPQSLGSLWDWLIGADNVKGNKNEPGNQLAGFDLRWVSPIGNLPYAIYGQMIGEDEAGYLPTRYIGQGGLEIWGDSAALDASWRLYLEAADTAAEFYKSNPRFGYAYEHGIYRDGYRYFGESLGHPGDNDSRIFSLGAVLAEYDGDTWRGWIKHADLNRDGKQRWRNRETNHLAPDGREWTGAGLTLDTTVKEEDIAIGIYVARDKVPNRPADTDFGAFFSWEHRFRAP